MEVMNDASLVTLLIGLDWSSKCVDWNNYRTYSISEYKNDIDNGGVYIQIKKQGIIPT